MTDGQRPTGPPQKRDDGPSGGELAGLGVQFALAIVVFLFAGRWLDNRIGTSPLFTLLGVFAGAAASFYSMYRRLNR